MKDEKLAPIAIFIYNRHELLNESLGSLLKNCLFSKSPVYVFCDGPKTNVHDKNILLTRNKARQILGDSVNYIYSDTNKGISESIFHGVSKLIKKYGKVIVVEDDLIVSSNFLYFMNNALEYYKHNENIYQISGYMFDTKSIENLKTTILLPMTTTWGWATWSRAWLKFDKDATGWQELKNDNHLRKKFNLSHSYDFSSMLENQMKLDIDSWGIRWYWSVFKSQGYVVYPPNSLVKNIGMTNKSSHGRGFFRSFYSKFDYTVRDYKFSETPNNEIEKAVFKTIKKQNGGFVGKVVDFLKKLTFYNFLQR